MRGLKGEEGGAEVDWKVEQYRTNRKDFLNLEATKDILDLRTAIPEKFPKSRLECTSRLYCYN